jgi:hypothetical protein
MGLNAELFHSSAITSKTIGGLQFRQQTSVSIQHAAFEERRSSTQQFVALLPRDLYSPNIGITSI